MDKKTGPAYMLPTTDPFRTNELHRVKGKDWKKIFQANGQGKTKAWVAILISDKISFKTRAIKRDKEGHFIILKGRIHQEEINIV